jgi:Xaa-Pro aminopeptidase
MTTGSRVDEEERADRLLDAQAKAAELFAAIGEEGIVAPGVRDSEASATVTALAAERFGVTRHWHKRIVRSGPHTLQPYQESPPDRTMTADDIVFADFGPVFAAWEADFGRTWVLGDDPVKLRLRDDLAVVFAAGKRYFEERPSITPAELYAEIVRVSEARGWEFGNYHCGHVVGEFPHENLPGGRSASMITPANTEPMRRTDPSGRIGHWILEVHLVDRVREIGGFYEELLTLPAPGA